MEDGPTPSARPSRGFPPSHAPCAARQVAPPVTSAYELHSASAAPYTGKTCVQFLGGHLALSTDLMTWRETWSAAQLGNFALLPLLPPCLPLSSFSFFLSSFLSFFSASSLPLVFPPRCSFGPGLFFCRFASFVAPPLFLCPVVRLVLFGVGRVWFCLLLFCLFFVFLALVGALGSLGLWGPPSFLRLLPPWLMPFLSCPAPARCLPVRLFNRIPSLSASPSER